MMTSGQTTRLRRGFTLLELIISIFIVSLFVGTAFTLSYSGSSKEMDFFAVEFENYVRETKLEAKNEGESIYLHFTPKVIYRTGDTTPLKFEEVKDGLPVPADITLFVRFKGDWAKVTGKNTYPTLFSRSGTLENFEIRATIDGAEAEFRFDQLTALPIRGL